MAHRDQLANYFRATHGLNAHADWVGTEVETFFVCDGGSAISLEQSQGIMRSLLTKGWELSAQKGDMLTELKKGSSKVLYELGYPNIELAVAPYEPDRLIERTRDLLDDIYRSAETVGAHPMFAPMFGGGDYLAVPDERDATWLQLDGKQALSPLAKISAVQFTLNVTLERAIETLNRLLRCRNDFLAAYPQDAVWREYIRASKAGYLPDRYGGPDTFESIEDYCSELARHDVVVGNALVPFAKAELAGNDSISLFIRSVWWYFRLRRYAHNLCIEVRPLPRRRDEKLQEQLDTVLSIIA